MSKRKSSVILDTAEGWHGALLAARGQLREAKVRVEELERAIQNHALQDSRQRTLS